MVEEVRPRSSLTNTFVAVILLGLMSCLVLMVIKENGRRAHAKVQGLIKNLDMGCEAYRVDHVDYPRAKNSAELHAMLDAGPTPNPPAPIIDAWGREIRYLFPSRWNKSRPDIWSIGQNGRDDSDKRPTDPEFDDICNWAKDY